MERHELGGRLRSHTRFCSTWTVCPVLKALHVDPIESQNCRAKRPFNHRLPLPGCGGFCGNGRNSTLAAWSASLFTQEPTRNAHSPHQHQSASFSGLRATPSLSIHTALPSNLSLSDPRRRKSRTTAVSRQYGSSTNDIPAVPGSPERATRCDLGTCSRRHPHDPFIPVHPALAAKLEPPHRR